MRGPVHRDEAAQHCSEDENEADHEPAPMLAPSGLPDHQLVIDEVGSRTRDSVCAWHDGDTIIGTMRPVKRDRDDVLSLHDQVAAEIRRDIAKGDVRPGERLPPARDMAAVLGVHANTVLRALRMLRDEGVLEFRRGRGVTVSGQPEHGVIWAQAQILLTQARRLGLQREDVVSIIEGLP